MRHHVTADPRSGPWHGRLREHGLTSSLSLPVVVGDRVDGALSVYGTEPSSFDELAESLLEDLAADLGFGLARLRDTADLARASELSARSADRLRATIDSLIDPFALLESVRDPDGRLVDLRYVEANRAALAYNRTTREQLIGHTMLELFPGLLEHGPLASYFAAIESGVPMVLDDVAYGNEILGETRRYDLRGVKNGDGLALTWRDTTERYAAQQEVARSQDGYRLLAEHASDFVLRSRPDGVIDWASPSVSRVLGWTQDELVGRDALSFSHPDELGRARRELARLNDGEEVTSRYRAAARTAAIAGAGCTCDRCSTPRAS